MDNRSTETLNQYMQKILDLRREREQASLSEEELERIALETGMTSEDLAHARKSLADHTARGTGFAGIGNWERAVVELEQAVALAPNNPRTLVPLAVSLWNRGVTQRNDQDKLRAMQYAERALQLEPTNGEAVTLVTHMTSGDGSVYTGRVKTIRSGTPGRKPIAIVAASIMVAVTGMIGVVFMNFADSSADESTLSEPPRPLPVDDVVDPTDAGYATQAMSFGSEGTGAGRFDDARSIAVDRAGRIYVGEYSSGRVQVFEKDGTFVTLWNVESKTPLMALAVSPDGKKVYTVTGGAIAIRDAATGALIGNAEKQDGEHYRDVTATPDGGFAGTQYGMRRNRESTDPWEVTDDIVLFGADGTEKNRIVKAITNVDDSSPGVNLQVAVDGQGRIYALNGHSESVFTFSRDGRYQNRFGSRGSEPGQLQSSDDIAVDGVGRVYVADINGVNVFGPDGRFLGLIDVPGSASGITIDANDGIWVVARSQVLRYSLKE